MQTFKVQSKIAMYLSLVSALTLPAFCQVVPPPNPAAASVDPAYVTVQVGKNVQKWLPAAKIPAGIQLCTNNGAVGYRDDQCLVIVNRDLPINPPTLVLPGGTVVYIRLDDAHWDETIAFNNAVVQAAPQDVSADVLKSFASPLSGFVGAAINTAITTQAFVFHVAPSEDVLDDSQVILLQKRAGQSLSTALPLIQDASTSLTCFESYRGMINENGKNICDPTGPLKPAGLRTAYDQLRQTIDTALAVALPTGELTAADAQIKTAVTTCPTTTDDDGCFERYDDDQKNEVVLNNELVYLQTAENTLLQTKLLLQNWPPFHNGLSQAFQTTLEKNATGTITITGVEIATKSSTTIATVVMNTTTIKHFVLSTGLMYTTTPYRSYSVGPQVVGGVVVTTPPATPGGAPTPVQQISKSFSSPSIDFPMVLGSVPITPWSHANWENRCRNHCAILFSAGAGLNIGAKSADLAGGPSFQFGGLLITAAAVGARQNSLQDGVYVGQTNSGITQASQIPTKTHWTVGGGLALTYNIPLL
ncbi:MAG: hypothetical protein ABI380_00895 [Edaphobacter sp.]